MADSLIASFTKRFTGGAVIRGELSRPLRGHSVTVLFGPSGCGKTTFLRCLAGLERPEEGKIEFVGETWFDAEQRICLTPQHRGVGFVFQDYALFPHLSVANNIGYGLQSLNDKERKQRVREMLERFALADLAEQRPRQLSGGQQQRVSLARALVCRPRLLLLDEPLSALDTVLREQLRGELRRLLAACEVPVLLVTHDRGEALALGDDLVVMSGGLVRQSGSVLDVFNRPANAEVARIVGVETVQPGRVVSLADGLVTVAVGKVQLCAVDEGFPSGTRDVHVCIRAEDVILFKDTGVVSSPRNRLMATVRAVSREGPMMRLDLDCGFPLAALLTRQACDELELQPGATVGALVKAPHVHLIPR